MSCPRCEINFDSNSRCPRVLACGHVFCSDCLQGLQHHQPISPTSPSPTTTFTCPHDKVDTRVPSSCPEDAVRALPREREILKVYEEAHIPHPRTRQCEVCDDDSHPATHRCVVCDQWLCSSMAKAHKKMKGFSSHVLEEIDESSTSGGVTSQSNACWDHDQLMVGYDTLCQRAVCTDCCVFGKHKGHNTVKLEEFAEHSRGHLTNSIAAGEALVRRLASFRQQHSALDLSLRESFENTNALIKASFSKVRRV